MSQKKITSPKSSPDGFMEIFNFIFLYSSKQEQGRPKQQDQQQEQKNCNSRPDFHANKNYAF